MVNPDPTASCPLEWGKLNVGSHPDEPPLPEDDPTVGIRMNHCMLRVRDPKKSLFFYKNLLGMRTIFTINAGPITTYYLTHPQTTEHRADLAKFSRETALRTQFTSGLLELMHVHGSEKQPEGYYTGTGNVVPALGFGHLGFTVPDVKATVARLEEHGVKVFKPLGVSDRATLPITSWETEKGVGLGDEDGLAPEFNRIVKSFVHVFDPDGYIIEIIPQKRDWHEKSVNAQLSNA
ncbi:lactoylglutathione lyase [Exophiala spinifera]|uniref:Lactoylglutathione lyase n=1 Tax=Exophiala spinifera TaxID=91928 RepID=A0A0D1YQR3_9EURO|nr:lactoylglutathione lyase [Exophiala spinifera]KIW17541.1 lactoylglutathione lyase [Exophiala spinifera]